MILFETDRLIVREYTPEDTWLVMQYSLENSKRTELPDEVFETLEEAENQISMCLKNYTEKTYPLVYAIELKKTKTLIGDILLSPIKAGIEVGYSIAERYQHNGYAAEALIPFTAWSRQNLGITTLYGLAKKSNIASWKTLEKAGFEWKEEKTILFFGKSFPFKIYTCTSQEK